MDPAAKGEARSHDTQGTEARTAHAEPERPETPSNRRVRTRTHGGVGGEEPRGSPLSRLRYGPADDSAHRLRLKASSMAEKVPFRPVHTARPPPFSLINSHPFGSARSSLGREAAKADP